MEIFIAYFYDEIFIFFINFFIKIYNVYINNKYNFKFYEYIHINWLLFIKLPLLIINTFNLNYQKFHMLSHFYLFFDQILSQVYFFIRIIINYWAIIYIPYNILKILCMPIKNILCINILNYLMINLRLIHLNWKYLLFIFINYYLL